MRKQEIKQTSRTCAEFSIDRPGWQQEERKTPEAAQTQESRGGSRYETLQEMEGSLCEVEGRTVQTLHLFQPMCHLLQAHYLDCLYRPRSS